MTNHAVPNINFLGVLCMNLVWICIEPVSTVVAIHMLLQTISTHQKIIIGLCLNCHPDLVMSAWSFWSFSSCLSFSSFRPYRPHRPFGSLGYFRPFRPFGPFSDFRPFGPVRPFHEF